MMTKNRLSDHEQDLIVDKLISNLDEMGPEDEFDEDLFNQLDDWRKIKVDAAIRDFADSAVGSEHWDSDE